MTITYLELTVQEFRGAFMNTVQWRKDGLWSRVDNYI
jgi:hypothetical protein